MDKFIIPQFIDVEDRVIGPITVRQFLVCTFGGLLIFVAYKLSDFYLFLAETIIIAGVTAVIAFVKINGKNFHIFLLDLFEYLLKVPKFAIWQRSEYVPIVKKIKEEKKEDNYIFVPKSMPSKKLSEISLIVDTGGFYTGEHGLEKEVQNQKNQQNI